MIQLHQFVQLRDELKSLKSFCNLVKKCRALEKNFREQNQSPGNPIRTEVEIFNSNFISKTELLYASFLCYYLNTTKLKSSCPILLCELLTVLPEKIERSEFLTNSEKISLYQLVLRERLHLDQSWPFPRREILGILNDTNISNKLLKRFYQRRRPRKVKRQERIRGYRDHGTLRPAHEWKPRHDFTLTELHQKIERQRKYTKDLLAFVRKGKQPIAVEDFPELFDK